MKLNRCDETLECMLGELESSRLVVIKVPGREGGYVRAVCTVNCEWYQRLCASHTTSRRRYPKPRTIIKRRNTVNALNRMRRGDRSSVYAQRILAVIQEMEYPFPCPAQTSKT